MGKLDTNRRALTLHEGDQRLETFGLRLVPDAEVMLVDDSNFLDACRLDKDQPETAERIAAEMHDVKCAAGISGIAAIVDHRRHDEAVLQRETPNRKRLEQHWPCRLPAID